MNSSASVNNKVSKKANAFRDEFLVKFNAYLATQPVVVRVLHVALKALAMICFVLPIVLFVIAIYHTFLWATTGSFTSLGQGTYLPIAWVNFGLSMSFMVFPWGLDAMLLRAFPTDAFLIYAYGNLNKPVKFGTGVGGFFAGLGIMCAGAPGAVTMWNLAVETLQKLF